MKCRMQFNVIMFGRCSKEEKNKQTNKREVKSKVSYERGKDVIVNGIICKTEEMRWTECGMNRYLLRWRRYGHSLMWIIYVIVSILGVWVLMIWLDWFSFDFVLVWFFFRTDIFLMWLTIGVSNGEMLKKLEMISIKRHKNLDFPCYWIGQMWLESNFN